jgi:sugar phosphate isomerase/epimerase
MFKTEKMKLRTLKTLILITLVSVCFSSYAKTKEVGLQLYSLRDDVKNLGIEKVLEKVGEMGYSKIELASYNDGMIYGMEPAKFKSMAEKNGLKVTSTHVVRKLTKDPKADMEFWEKAINTHAGIGAKYIVMPAYPFNPKNPVTMEDVEKVCEYFNKVGKMAKDAGIEFGFHNHAHEFTNTIDGLPLYDIMLEKLDPEYVFLQMDVYWVQEGGYDPVDYLKNYPGRFTVLHIKDKEAIGASGNMDFKAIFKAAYKQGMVDYYVEVEEYKGTPMEDVKESFDFLNDAKYVK